MAIQHPYSLTTPLMRSGAAALAAVLLLAPIFSFGQNPRQVLHSFGGGRVQLNAPVAASDGTISDTTRWGGSHDCGTFSTVSPQGQVTTLFEFGGYDGDGRNPNSPVASTDGNYYGLTAFGGANGFGTVFKITPAGAESILHSFTGGVSDGAHPVGTLVVGTDGSFYGVTSEGGSTDRPYGAGVVFKITPQGQESVVTQFSDPNDFALAAVAAHPDGNLYALQDRTDGTTSLLSINPQGVSTELYRSQSGLRSPLIVGPDSNLYCLNQEGILKATTTGTTSQAAVFSLTGFSAMAFGSDGSLYAAAGDALYSVGPTGALAQIHDFAIDGFHNITGIYTLSAGQLVATLTSPKETLQTVSLLGAATLVTSFPPSAQTFPQGALCVGNDRKLYGIVGDPQQPLIAISLTPGGIDTPLCSLPSTGPFSPFVQGSDGNLYTITSSGCAGGFGGVIKVPLAGAASILYSFATQAETMTTDSPLVAGLDGCLYGVTNYGGANNTGAIVQLSLTGARTIVCYFPGGYGPSAPDSLVQAADGSFFGSSIGIPFPSIFHYSPSGGLSMLYQGSGQVSPPVIGQDGGVYFYTPFGFELGVVTLYRFDPSNSVLSAKHSFPAYQGDATSLSGPPLAGSDGMIYVNSSTIDKPDSPYRIAPSGDDAPTISIPYNSSPYFRAFSTGPIALGPDGFYGTEVGSVDFGYAAYYKLSAPPKLAYTVTTAPSDSTLAPGGGGQYAYNTTATVHAHPDQSYEFTGWTEDGIQQSLSPDYSFTVLRDRTLQANYVETFNIQVPSYLSNGTVTGAGRYATHSTATLNFVPNPGNVFLHWRDDGNNILSTSPTYQFVVNTNLVLYPVTESAETISVTTPIPAEGIVGGGGVYGMGSSVTVTAAPSRGWSFLSWTENGAAVSTDASYTFTANTSRNLVALFGAPVGPPQWIGPATGAVLTSSTADLQWNPGESVAYYWITIGTAPGLADLYASSLLPGRVLGISVSGLPTDGSTLYARLWSLAGHSWQHVDYTLAAFTDPVAPVSQIAKITSLPINATLPALDIPFDWSVGAAASHYFLWLGSRPGAYDYYASAYLPGDTLGITVHELPSSRIIYATLWSLLDTNKWAPSMTTYTAFSGTTSESPSKTANIFSPAANATLTRSASDFVWNPASGASRYVLFIGSLQGGNDLYSSPFLPPSTTGVRAAGLPTNGRPLYARLFQQSGRSWLFTDTTFHAAQAGAASILPSGKISEPAPGAVLESNAPAIAWTPGADAAAYLLFIGSKLGADDLFASPVLTAGTTSITVSNLPGNGQALFLRLWSAVGGAWVSDDVTCTAVTQ